MKQLSKAFLLLLIVSLFSLMIFEGFSKSASRSANQKTIILAHAMHNTHPVSVAMENMAEYAEEYSDGQLRVKIYPQGQLGSERELLELAQIGTIGITKVSGAVLENIVPPIQVFSLPYLFRDEQHMEKVFWGELGDELLEEGAKYMLRGLAYYDAGQRSFYTKDRPIETPSDLEGMKIRVQPSITAMNLIRNLGGSPTPLAYGELYTAFQGGIVDGAENNPPSFYTSRHYEVTNYYSLDKHTAVPDVLIINSRLWDSLTDQEKQWLDQAANESVKDQRVLWKESVEESMRVVKEAGVEVLEPDTEPFRKLVEPIYNRIEENNPDLYEWVERIRAVN